MFGGKHRRAAIAAALITAGVASVPAAALASGDGTSVGSPGATITINGSGPAHSHRDAADARPAHTAMKLILTRDKRELKALKSTKATVNSYVAKIDASCPAALERVGDVEYKDVNQTALSLVSLELLMDTVDVTQRAKQSGIKGFTEHLEKLHWSEPAKKALGHYAKLELALRHAPESGLCADLNTYAEKTRVAPAATKKFDKSVLTSPGFAAIFGVATDDGFYSVLRRARTSSDTHLYARMQTANLHVELKYLVVAFKDATKLSKDVDFPGNPLGAGIDDLGIGIFFS